MATIGIFIPSNDGGWTGTIRTLSINARVRLVPNDSRDDSKAPAYRLMLGHRRIGDAWEAQTSNDDRPRAYLRVRFDDPAFPAPIDAALFSDPEGVKFQLIWNRRSFCV